MILICTKTEKGRFLRPANPFVKSFLIFRGDDFVEELSPLWENFEKDIESKTFLYNGSDLRCQTYVLEENFELIWQFRNKEHDSEWTIEKSMNRHDCNEYRQVYVYKKLKTIYPIAGFAPGNYENNCVDCSQKFRGASRAVQCESCAVKMMDNDLKEIVDDEEIKLRTLWNSLLADVYGSISFDLYEEKYQQFKARYTLLKKE